MSYIRNCQKRLWRGRTSGVVYLIPYCRKLVFGFAICLAISNCASVESDFERGRRAVARAIASHGGESVRNLRTIVQEWRTSDAQAFESRNPTPPWDMVQRWEGFAADFQREFYAEARIDRASGYDWINGLIVNREGSHRLDYRSETRREVSLSFEQALADMAAWSPIVLLRWLSEQPDAVKFVARSEHEMRLIDEIVVKMAGEEITIMFDVDNGQVQAIERSYVDFDGTRIPLHLAYLDYVEDYGIRYPSTVELRSRGFLTRSASLMNVSVNGPIDSHLLVPTAFQLTQNEPADVRNFREEELAKGVLFLGEGVMYQLIVEFDEFLVALDGSSGDVMKRIAAAQARFPGKEFRYVLASHHHNDHLHGLDEFVAMGASVLAAPEHNDTILRYLNTQLRDMATRLIPVNKKFVIRSRDREIQIIDIGPVPHSEHLLVAYLPAEKILFEADLFVLGGRRLPMKPGTKNSAALLEAIDSHGLDVELIVDPHSPLIATISDLQDAVALGAERELKAPTAERAYLSEWQSVADSL